MMKRTSSSRLGKAVMAPLLSMSNLTPASNKASERAGISS